MGLNPADQMMDHLFVPDLNSPIVYPRNSDVGLYNCLKKPSRYLFFCTNIYCKNTWYKDLANFSCGTFINVPDIWFNYENFPP